MRVLDVFILLIGGGLLSALTILMVRRRLHQIYPFFFLCTVFSLLLAFLFLVMSCSNKGYYYYIYWVTDAISAVFALLALHEAFYDVFHDFYAFLWFRLIFPGTFSFVFLIAVRRALFTHFAPVPPLMWVILSVESAMSFFRVGVLLAFMLLALGLRMRCPRHPYNIALGFAVSGAGHWIAYLMVAHSTQNPWVRYVRPVLYICATLIWLTSFSRKPEPGRNLEFRMARSRRRRPGESSTPKLENA